MSQENTIQEAAHPEQLGPQYDLDDINEQNFVEQRAIEPTPPLTDRALPSRMYLEQNVIDPIYNAMKALARERPLNPIEFFSYFLITQSQQQQK